MPDFKYTAFDSSEEIIHYDEADVVAIDRCDFVSQNIGKVTKTEEGYLRGEVPVAKVGVMKYLLADGTTRSELVPANTLFNADSMSTLKMQPITDTHPPEIMLDSRTIRRRRIGTTGENIRRQDDYLMSPIAITDEEGIASVNNGRHQFSPGYKCHVILKSGTFNGVHFDAIQIKRIYNHLALCDRARGGNDLKLKLDGLSVEEIERLDGFEIITQQKEIPIMPKYRIDGIDYDAAQEVINFTTKLQAKVDELTAKVTTLGNEKTVLQAKIDEQKEKIETLEKRDVKSEIAAGVKNRLNLEKAAIAVLDEEAVKKLDSMSDLDIKKAIIVAKSPAAKLDGQSEIYIQARYDSIVENLDFDPEAINRQRQSATQKANHDSTDPIEKAQLDSEKAILNAHLTFGK